MKKTIMIIQFNDGETLRVQADFFKEDGRGFFDFMKSKDEEGNADFMASVNSACVKYVVKEEVEE